MKTCVTCLQEKEEEEFNWRYQSLGIRAKICRDCQHGHQRTWYEDHRDQEKERTRRTKVINREKAREYIQRYKETHPCSQCDESDPTCLDFHHVRGKGANVTTLVSEGASLERIKVEISLCIILCSNCHRKLTASERRK